MFPNENSVSLCLFTTWSLKYFISCNSDNSVETVIIIGNTFLLWDKHVINMVLLWISNYKHCLAMKPLSSVVVSVVAYLDQLGLLQWPNICCRSMSKKYVKFIETTCFIRTCTLILVVYSMFPHENSVSLRFFNTSRLKRFITCNSDNSVETVIIIGNTFILWDKHYLNVCLRWISHY